MIMKKHISVFLLVLCLISTACIKASAQRTKTVVAKPDTSVVRAYLDSLIMVKQELQDDSLATVVSSYSPRLFGPATFYHDVTRDVFTPGFGVSPVSLSLLSVYLSRPDLISNTQSRMEQARGVDEQIETPIVSNPNLVTHEALPQATAVEVPSDLVVIRPRFWTYKGDYSLQFMQNYVSGNWYKGGESSYAALGAVTMEANYNNKQKVKWDNKLELKLGMQNTRSDSIHPTKTTEDLIRITSKYGLQATKHWYYTLQLIGQTQFTHSYKSNDETLYAHFLAPGTLNLSLGMDYNVDWLNHRLKGNIHLAPAAYNMKYTRLRNLAERIGLEPDRHFKHDVGSLFTIDLTWEISDQLRWKTRMYGYTAYERVEYEWENTFQFQFNKWISAQLFVYPRFDDAVVRGDKHGYWQFKEFSSIGFQFVF